MNKFSVVCCVVVFLTGCATVWHKPGASESEFSKDSYECERDSRQSGYFGTGIAGAVNFQNFYQRCLISKGWVKSQGEENDRPVTRVYRRQAGADNILECTSDSDCRGGYSCYSKGGSGTECRPK